MEQAELEKQQSLLQEKLQPWHPDGPTISKNKKRKLKKKQQIERKKVAGLLPGASGVSFMYQPEEDSSEQDGVGESHGGAVPDAGGEGTPDVEEEDVESTQEKVAGILNFLKSTQEVYFYDDVFMLDHMKTLLLLRDTEGLTRALEVFPEHCGMPPDYARVISAFFSYWITRVLPEKNTE
ncbi:Glutamate-rich protein 1 [Camelus dromedarius]|nr:Glutamate-rich protein 1 [Camelus dromedarius]